MSNSIKPFVQDGLVLLSQYLIAGLVVAVVYLFTLVYVNQNTFTQFVSGTDNAKGANTNRQVLRII